MTFPGPEVAVPTLRGVPAAIDGDDRARACAARIAGDLGMTSIRIHGDRRLYHAAAVLAGNFATVLLADAARVLSAAGIEGETPARALAPLAIASLRNAAADPVAALTGPAARGDRATVEAHTAALHAAGMFEVERLYRELSERAWLLASAQRGSPGSGSVR